MLRIADSEREDTSPNIAARMRMLMIGILNKKSRASVNIGQNKNRKPVHLAAASGQIAKPPMVVVDGHDNVDVEKQNGDRTPDHFTLFKSIVEACIAGDATALPRYPPDHPRHADAECLFRFYNKPNAPTVADLSNMMQTYMDDVLLHTSKATGHENLIAAFIKCKFVHQHFDLYNLANNFHEK